MSYTVSKLIERLQEVKDKYGDIPVEMCTEVNDPKSPQHGQVQQEVADLAVAPASSTVGAGHRLAVVVLLPEGF
jgi:hypothetical protein